MKYMEMKLLKIAAAPQFKGLTIVELQYLLKTLCAKELLYARHSVIARSGDGVGLIGIVLEGRVLVITDDASGNETLIDEILPGDMFGEVFPFAGEQKLALTYFAASSVDLLELDYNLVKNFRESKGTVFATFYCNLLGITAKKLLRLYNKNEMLSKRSTRDKILYYIDHHRKGKRKFVLKLNREEMAQYLCVDRSALSKELCRMRDEGLLSFNRNHFEVHYEGDT